MKTIKIMISILLTFSLYHPVSAQTEKNSETSKVTSTEKVMVYYFHYTRRCATCNAVESVTKEALEELYGNKVVFTSINLDEKEGEKKGKSLKVSGQTLLITAGDKQINITTEGFMNARSNPDKLKEIIKEKIDKLI